MTTPATERPIFDPAKLLPDSPEGVPGQKCPFCGSLAFIGVDVTMAGWQQFSGETYDAYDEEMGEYEYVHCAECDRLVWYDQTWFLPDEQVDDILSALRPCADDLKAATRIFASHRLSSLLDMVGERLPKEASC